MKRLKQSMRTNEKSEVFVVREYFRRIALGDVQGTLSLFSDNAVIHEPFSKSKYLSGKSEIEPFLNSVVLANQGLEYCLKIKKINHIDNTTVIADVTFRKEGRLRCNITFELKNKKAFKKTEKSVGSIKLMNIEFVD